MFNDEFQIINLIAGVNFSNEFNVDILSKFLPVSYIGSTYVKDVEYYGVNGNVVRISSRDIERGLKKEIKAGKQRNTTMKNIIDIDFQIEDKNIHLKVSKNNIHVTGVKSYEMLENMMNSFIELIIETEDKVKKLFSLRDDDINLIIESIAIATEEGKYNYLDKQFMNNLRFLSSKFEFDIELTELLIGYTCEEGDLRNNLFNLFKLKSSNENILYDSFPNVVSVEKYNGMYTFNVKYNEIILADLAVILMTEYKKTTFYIAEFDNRIKMSEDITVNDEYEMCNENIKVRDNVKNVYFKFKDVKLIFNRLNKKKVLKRHQLEIGEKGRIQMNSPCTLNIVNKVVDNLHKLFDEIYYKDEIDDLGF